MHLDTVADLVATKDDTGALLRPPPPTVTVTTVTNMDEMQAADRERRKAAELQKTADSDRLQEASPTKGQEDQKQSGSSENTTGAATEAERRHQTEDDDYEDWPEFSKRYYDKPCARCNNHQHAIKQCPLCYRCEVGTHRPEDCPRCTYCRCFGHEVAACAARKEDAAAFACYAAANGLDQTPALPKRRPGYNPHIPRFPPTAMETILAGPTPEGFNQQQKSSTDRPKPTEDFKRAYARTRMGEHVTRAQFMEFQQAVTKTLATRYEKTSQLLVANGVYQAGRAHFNITDDRALTALNLVHPDYRVVLDFAHDPRMGRILTGFISKPTADEEDGLLARHIAAQMDDAGFEGHCQLIKVTPTPEGKILTLRLDTPGFWSFDDLLKRTVKVHAAGDVKFETADEKRTTNEK